MLLWTGVGGQLFSSGCCGLGLVVSYSHQVAVVRAWLSAIVSSCCCGLGLAASYPHHVGVVRGWWSTIVKGWWLAVLTSCCYGQGMWSVIFTSCCCGHGLVVNVGGRLRTHSFVEFFCGTFGSYISVAALEGNIGGRRFPDLNRTSKPCWAHALQHVAWFFKLHVAQRFQDVCVIKTR